MTPSAPGQSLASTSWAPSLSAAGLGLIVLGTLQSSVWGLIQPKDAPIEPFGLAPTLFVIAAGGVLLWAFVAWQRHREAIGSDPLVHLDLLKILPLRSGLIGLFTQNLLLMGVFFTIPLYLQLVLGLDALQTGLKMLPVSIAMFAASAAGSRLSARYSVRAITRAGLILSGIACVMLLATIQPDLADLAFAASMGVLGAGMGLIASQLGLVVQSSVDASGRGEAGGLQFTGQQLGSSLGVALIGAIVLAGLTSTFVVEHPGRLRASARRSPRRSGPRSAPGSTSSPPPTSRRPRRRPGSTRPRPPRSSTTTSRRSSAR